jgi:hypothetical protein
MIISRDHLKLVPTPFKRLNEILGGGLPLKTFTGIMGAAGHGKSIILNELAVSAAKELNGNILVVNTEEAEGLTNEMWAGPMAKKYGWKGELFVEYTPNLLSLLTLHGITAGIFEAKAKGGKKEDEEDEDETEPPKNGEKPAEGDQAKPKKEKKPQKPGKREIRPVSVDYAKSKLMDYIDHKNVKVIIYDSFTTPFTPLLAGGQQNLSLRNTSQALLFEAIRSILAGKDVFLLSSHHITLNPMDPYKTREDIEMKGGKEILHTHKIVFYLEQSGSRYTSGVRSLYIVRHPMLPDWKYFVQLLLDNNGYKEINEEEVRMMMAMAKAELNERRKEKEKLARQKIKLPAKPDSEE